MKGVADLTVALVRVYGREGSGNNFEIGGRCEKSASRCITGSAAPGGSKLRSESIRLLAANDAISVGRSAITWR